MTWMTRRVLSLNWLENTTRITYSNSNISYNWSFHRVGLSDIKKPLQYTRIIFVKHKWCTFYFTKTSARRIFGSFQIQVMSFYITMTSAIRTFDTFHIQVMYFLHKKSISFKNIRLISNTGDILLHYKNISYTNIRHISYTSDVLFT